MSIQPSSTSCGFRAFELRKTFGKKVVLDDLTLDVPVGCTLGLLGENGSGKSTLLKILLGLIPADGGEALVAGEASARLSPAVREKIGYVVQSPGQFPWLSGKAMLEYVGSFYPTYDRDYARALADRWRLSLRTPIGLLSPGQQQRLSIVRALATRPTLLVLDEPIASIDPATRLAVIDELLAQREQRELTVIFSSHITGDLERFCSHFAVLANGKIAMSEPTSTIRALRRLTIEGEESKVAALSLGAAKHVREAPGKRIVVVEESRRSELLASLPDDVNVKSETRDLESVLSEWMQ